MPFNPWPGLLSHPSSLHQVLEHIRIQLDRFTSAKCPLKLFKEFLFWSIPKQDYMRIKSWPKQYTIHRQISIASVSAKSFLTLNVRSPCLFKGRIPPGIKIRRSSELLSLS